MKDRKSLDEVIKEVCEYNLPKDIFDDGMNLQLLKEEYLRRSEPFVRKVLSFLGFTNVHIDSICEERIGINQPGLLYVGPDNSSDPKELLDKIVLADSDQELEKWMKKTRFKRWDDVSRYVKVDAQSKYAFVNEQDELRYCLMLDMLYNLILGSKDKVLFGRDKKRKVIDVMRRETKKQVCASRDLVRLVVTQINLDTDSKSSRFCNHHHYYSLITKNREVKKDLDELDMCKVASLMPKYMFSSDEKWNKKSNAVLKSSDGDTKAKMLLEMLLEYFYEISDSLLWKSRTVPVKSRTMPRKYDGKKNTDINMEYIPLYCQMPYHYISEWLITYKGRESLCPLLKTDKLKNFRVLLADFDKDGVYLNFKRRDYCQITSEFGEGGIEPDNRKAYLKGGSGVSVLQRRITQFCFFQYVVNCIKRLEEQVESGFPKDEKTGKKYLMEVFRIQYLVNKSRFFKGYQSYIKKQILGDSNKDNQLEKSLGSIKESTLFWNTFLYYLSEKRQVRRITTEEIDKMKTFYNECIESACEGNKEMFNKLALEVFELAKQEVSLNNNGMSYLLAVKSLLEKTMRDYTLKGDVWKKIDDILGDVYDDRNRETKNNFK